MALGDHLYDYVRGNLKNHSGNYLEIGVFNGDGFASVASTFPDKICYALDPFIEDGHTSNTTSVATGGHLVLQKENFLNATKQLSNVNHFETTSVNFLNSLSEQQIVDMDVSCVLIDGSHHYVDVVNDYQLSMRLLSKNKTGIILFDDLHVPDVKRAYDEFHNEYKKYIVNFGGIGGNSEFVLINYEQ